MAAASAALILTCSARAPTAARTCNQEAEKELQCEVKHALRPIQAHTCGRRAEAPFKPANATQRARSPSCDASASGASCAARTLRSSSTSSGGRKVSKQRRSPPRASAASCGLRFAVRTSGRRAARTARTYRQIKKRKGFSARVSGIHTVVSSAHLRVPAAQPSQSKERPGNGRATDRRL